MRLVSCEYTKDHRAQRPGVGSQRHLSVIAQELAEVFPDCVKGCGEWLPNRSEILLVDAWPLTVYSAAAVQELSHAIAEKDAENGGERCGDCRFEGLNEADGSDHS